MDKVTIKNIGGRIGYDKKARLAARTRACGIWKGRTAVLIREARAARASLDRKLS